MGPFRLSRPAYPGAVVTWIADDAFELGGTTYFCRPVGGRFPSEPGRFCLLKAPPEVEWYEHFLRDRSGRSIVEVGSYDGASSAFFAEIAHPTRLITIDRRPEPTAALTEFIARRDLGAVVTPYNGVDQGDTTRLREILDEAFGTAPIDLVVDDASHLVDLTRTTFNCLFPRLAVGGSYVIEDWAWAHNFMGKDHPLADQRPLTALIFELILACASQPKVVKSVNVFRHCAVIERGPAEIDPATFDLAKCFGPRGAALIAD